MTTAGYTTEEVHGAQREAAHSRLPQMTTAAGDKKAVQGEGARP